MGNATRKGLVSMLRSRIADDRPTVKAFSIGVSSSCRSAILEITNGFFIVTVTQGEKARSIRFGLNLPMYDTVGKLVAAISREPGYDVATDDGFAVDHPSLSLRTADGGMKDISKGASETLRHTIFSDAELLEILQEATTVHNPNYSVSSVPEAEHPYVLAKATARVYRVIASDSVKRKGLDADAKTLLALATDLEDQYSKDVARQKRVIPVAKIDESRIHGGDVINGKMVRRSLRAGYTSSWREALPPAVPVLFSPSEEDVEDTKVRLRWKASREESFRYVELWRDVNPQVERGINGRLGARDTTADPQLPTGSQYSLASTSQQVLGSSLNGTSGPVFDGFFFGTIAEVAGGAFITTTFVDGKVEGLSSAGGVSLLGQPLEPEVDYYYRLYVVNWNGEIGVSDVVKVRTKRMRALFSRSTNGQLAPGAVSPTEGPIAGGTTLTITGSHFEPGTKVQLGVKLCTEVSRTSTELVVTTPGLQNADFVGIPQTLTLISPNGLRDIVINAFEYTA